MRQPLRLARVLAALAAIGVVTGCGLTGKLTGTPKANQPPHTVLFVNGPVDTVNHIVHLFWFGTDPDGSVVGFQWKMVNPRQLADTSWHSTVNTDSVFTIFADSGFANPVFSVRAIDNRGAVDPNPPRQDFLFSNQAPTVTLVQKPLPTDTTFASVSVTWTSNDPDGDASKLTYLVYLDGNEKTPEITTGQSLTMPTARFLTNGVFTPGKRKLFVRAIDDGGREGLPDSVTWNVRSAVTGSNHGRLLIVDDVFKGNSANARFDGLYARAATNVGLTASQYTILRLDTTQPFRTALDIQQTFSLFETVVWYRDNEQGISSILHFAEPGIGAYLDAGGNFYLDGLYLFAGRNANGPLSEDFVRTRLDSRGLVTAFTTTPTFADTSAGFGNTGTAVFHTSVNIRGTVVHDSLNMVNQILQTRSGEAGGLRQFDYKDASEVVLWGVRGALTPDVRDSTAVGMSVQQSAGGRLVVVCTAPGAASGNPPLDFVTAIFRQLGLDQPPRPASRLFAAMRR